MSVRQQLVTAVEAALAGIRKTNGYATNAGATLQPWRTRMLGKDEDRPALTVRDPADVIARTTYGLDSHGLTLEVEGATDGDATAADLRELAADLLKALGADPTWGGLAEDTALTGVRLDVVQDGIPTGMVTVTAVVQYETDPWTL